MVLGLALIVSGAIVLYALRRALWRRLDDEEPETPPPPAERVHHVGPDDDPIDIPLDDGEYAHRPIYVPPERGTVYVSRALADGARSHAVELRERSFDQGPD